MKRRGFLASLFALPAAAVAASRVKEAAPVIPPPVEPVVQQTVELVADKHPWSTICYSASISPDSLSRMELRSYNDGRMRFDMTKKR